MVLHRSVFKGITRNIFLLGIVSLFTDLGSQMVFPLIPLYLITVLGAGAYTVGIVEGAAESTASLLKVISGHWSDRVQKRKPFILFGYSLSALTKPLFAFVNLWGLVLVIRIVERVGKGLRTAPRDALVAESCNTDNRGKAFGFHRAMDGIGSTSGAIIAYLLLGIFDYEDIFLISIIPGIFAVIAVAFIQERNPSFSTYQHNSSLHVNLSVLPAKLKLFILVSSVFAMGHFGYAFLLLKALDIGLADNRAILLYAMFYAIYTVCTIPAGALSDRIGRYPVLITGYVLFAITSLGLIFTSSTMTLFLFFITYGIFFALIDGTQRAFVVDISPSHLKATALGTFHTAIGLVSLPGGFIAGILWDKLNPEATFIYGLSLSSIAIVLFVFINKKFNSSQ